MNRTLAALAALAVLSAGPAIAGSELWTWSLYENPSSITLALEVPDTDKLSATMECSPGSGQAKVSVYPDAAKPGEKLQSLLPVRDPPFQGLMRNGKLTLRSGERSASVSVPTADRPKLERFATLCGA